MEEELVRAVSGQSEWHRAARVLRLRRWRHRKTQHEETRQEDHPPVRMHQHPPRPHRELPQREHVRLLCGDQRQDARVCS